MFFLLPFLTSQIRAARASHVAGSLTFFGEWPCRAQVSLAGKAHFCHAHFLFSLPSFALSPVLSANFAPQVTPGSVWEKSGVRTGDFVLALNGTWCTDVDAASLTVSAVCLASTLFIAQP
jgi:hypothetical protein